MVDDNLQTFDVLLEAVLDVKLQIVVAVLLEAVDDNLQTVVVVLLEAVVDNNNLQTVMDVLLDTVELQTVVDLLLQTAMDKSLDVLLQAVTGMILTAIEDELGMYLVPEVQLLVLEVR